MVRSAIALRQSVRSSATQRRGLAAGKEIMFGTEGRVRFSASAFRRFPGPLGAFAEAAPSFSSVTRFV